MMKRLNKKSRMKREFHVRFCEGFGVKFRLTHSTMCPSSANLQEVVVTALGIKKETRKIGYAVQEVKGEDLVKARDSNPITGLTGKVAGLSVAMNAELLGAPSLLLRGNQISLFVIDGVPISSDTYNLSPDDIETFTVLKGTAGAALYGSRAQYGAILITTKKAKKEKGITVEVNSTNSIDKGFIAEPQTQHEYGGGMYANMPMLMVLEVACKMPNTNCGAQNSEDSSFLNMTVCIRWDKPIPISEQFLFR